MKKLVAVLTCFAMPATAIADSEDTWPVLHDVLAHQRELPCKEIQGDGTDATTYAMTFDAGGRLLRREDDRGNWQRYRYRGGRIVSIAGERPALSESFVTTISYGKRGIAAVETRSKMQLGPVLRLDGSKPKYRTRVFNLKWQYDGNRARVTAAFDGHAERGADVLHYERGRLVSTDLDSGDVVTATYDAAGRLTTMTSTYQGKAEAVIRYQYDGKGRLVREEFDRKLDGEIDLVNEFSYSCKRK